MGQEFSYRVGVDPAAQLVGLRVRQHGQTISADITPEVARKLAAKLCDAADDAARITTIMKKRADADAAEAEEK
jgi:hypothetical protein